MTGMDETVGQFSALGVPQPQLSGYIAAIGEMAGGAFLFVVCSPLLSPGHWLCSWGVPCISCTWATGFLLPMVESNTHWYCCYPC